MNTQEVDPIKVCGEDEQVIFRLKRDGTIIYKGREVESDDELRESVNYLVKRLSGQND